MSSEHLLFVLLHYLGVHLDVLGIDKCLEDARVLNILGSHPAGSSCCAPFLHFRFQLLFCSSLLVSHEIFQFKVILCKFLHILGVQCHVWLVHDILVKL